MIYETAIVVRAEAGEEAINAFKSSLEEAIKSFNGEILVTDNWGIKSFAQPIRKGITKGNYFYFIYKADGNVNTELERRFRISEDVLKFLFVSLGEDSEAAELTKNYKNPLNAAAEGGKSDLFKERKAFSKRKSCWFSENKTQPDWKDPSSYSWLVNEFGKISPARVTGLRPKFQRMANTAIKRGRNIGLISHVSGRTVR